MSPKPDTRDLPGQQNVTEATADFRPVPAAESLAPTEATGEYRPAAPEQTAAFVPSSDRPATAETIDADAAPSAPPTPPATPRTGRAEPPADEPPAEGRTGRYLLRKFHARGGMGEVWLAEDAGIGRQVALKRMRGRRADQKDRFLLEAQITGQLEHPGVVPVHEVGLDDEGQPFYVMKFIQGDTLKDVIDAYRKIPAGNGDHEVEQIRLLQTFIQLCQTVAFAHSKGVIHRDLKPDNVMVGAFGETQLLDWGLAKPVGSGAESLSVHLSWSEESSGTLEGSIKGTPSYMAPEVAEGHTHEVDESSDIYLLGATLYHMLTGHRPRESKKVTELLEMARKVDPPAPRKLDATIAKPLEAIVRKAMARQKADRYASAKALAEDVQRFLAGEPVTAYKETIFERTWRWIRKHRVALARCAAALLLLAAGLWGWAAWQEYEARREAERVAAALELKSAQEKTARLEKLKKAEADVKEFRRLAGETLRHFALQNPAAEFSPASRPEATEAAASKAAAALAPWGADLRDLPPEMDKEKPALREALYEVLLLHAETRARRAKEAAVAKETLALLDRAAALRPATLGLVRLQADYAERRGEADEAKALRKTEAAAPVTALDRFLTAERWRIDHARAGEGRERTSLTAAERKLLDRAVEEYKKVIELDYRHFWSHFWLGQCYWLQRKGELARNSFDAAVAVRPDLAWGYIMRGSLRWGLFREYDEAKEDLDHAVRLDPELREARLHRGVLLFRQGKHKEALADLEVAAAGPPERRLIEAVFSRGELHLEQKDEHKALADFNLVLKERPGGHIALVRRARIHLARGDVKAGVADLNAYATRGGVLPPNGPEASSERARWLRRILPEMPAHRREAHRKLMLAEARAAVAAGAKSADVYDELGAALELNGKMAEAADAYGVAMMLSPREARLSVKRGWAFEKLAGLQVQRNDVAAARAALDCAAANFRNGMRLERGHAEALAGLGYVHACLNKRGEGARYAGEALLHGAGDYLALINAACVYATLADGDPERAREFRALTLEVLRRAVELWKGDRAGPDPRPLIGTDPAFARLRGLQEFDDLIANRP